MTTTRQGILALVKSAILQAPQVLPEGFDLEAAYPVIRSHQISTLAFEGALLCGIPRSHPVMQKLFQSYCKALAVTEGQQREINRITAAFQEAGIHYMPLKGFNMRPRYPKPELRLMGDIDVLIRLEQYSEIESIMRNLGYERVIESDHEMIWEKSALHVELHKRIVPSYNKDLYAYFGTGWDFAHSEKDFCHSMTAEDEFVYIFSHFAKHYRDGGIGCRHVSDLWVFLRTYSALDEAQVEHKLSQLGLLEFYGNIRRLIAVWFEDADADEKTEFMTEFLFDSGVWGAHEAHVLSQGLRNSRGGHNGLAGKLTYLCRLALPNQLAMKQLYPVLQKYPALLPAYWLWRPIDKTAIQRKSMDNHREKLAMLTTDKLEDRRAALRYVGLKIQ